MHSLGRCSVFCFRSRCGDDSRSSPARAPRRGPPPRLSALRLLRALQSQRRATARRGEGLAGRGDHARCSRSAPMHRLQATTRRKRDAALPPMDCAPSPDRSAAPLALLGAVHVRGGGCRRSDSFCRTRRLARLRASHTPSIGLWAAHLRQTGQRHRLPYWTPFMREEKDAELLAAFRARSEQG
jgi:hypothetical protein